MVTLLGAAFSGALVVVALILIVLLIIANWMIFAKAGEPGWKSIIPVYNLYILFKITWSKKMFWINLLITIVYSIFDYLCSTNDSNVLFAILLFASAVAMFVFYIILNNKLAKAFGHGAGYTVLLLFFPNIMTLILGFGSDQYIGPQE